MEARRATPPWSDRSGQAVGQFRATVAGSYRIDVTGTSVRGATVAVGNDITQSAMPGAVGSVALLMLGVVVGTLTFVLRRSTTRP